MPFQEYEDGISYIERGSLPGAINYAQKSATESFPADDRRGSNNGGQQLVKQPLRGKSAYPLMFSGFCILACSVTLWMGMLFFTGYIPAASYFSSTYSHLGFPLLFLASFLTGFFSLTGFYLGFPLLFLGAALLLIGLALRLKPAYSTVYGMCVSGAITLVLGLESLLALWIPFDSLRLVFHISETPLYLEPRWLVVLLLIFGVAILLIGLSLLLKPGHILAYGLGISGGVMLAFSLVAWLTTLAVYNQGDTSMAFMLGYYVLLCAPIFVVVGAVLFFRSLWVFLRTV